MTYDLNFSKYDTWKLGLDDPHFDDAPEWPPCYEDDSGLYRNTDTGRIMSEKAFNKMREEWGRRMSDEEIEAADSQVKWDKFTAKQDRERRKAMRVA